MEQHDDDAKAVKPEPRSGIERETDAVSVSLTGSSFENDEKRQRAEHQDESAASGGRTKERLSTRDHDDAASAYSGNSSSSNSSHSTEHGEADPENEMIQETVPGRELDRQLSKVHDIESLRRIETRGSIKSKVSRVLSAISGRRAKDAEGIRHEPLPETNLDEGIVGWDGQDDPQMPLNFQPFRKWLLVGLLSTITLLTPFASSILSPGISSLMVEFGESQRIVGSMTVSIYLLGYVVGPMVMAPMGEIYGRRPVLTAANIFFCCWQIGCALAPNIGSLIVFRFLSGVGGAGCLTVGGAVIGDLFWPEQRGFAMGIWTVGPLMGPILGPLIGGFIAETIGWRWDFWIVLIVSVLVTVFIEVFNQETSHRIIIEKKVMRLSKETGRTDLRSCYDNNSGPKLPRKRIIINSIVRPIKMLTLSPVVLLLTIYISFTYGTLYLLFTTIPTVFQQTYGFSVGLTGLVYLGLGTGSVLGWLVITLYSDKSVIKLAKANNGVFEPEMRLAMTIGFSWLLPITFFWYGWTAQYRVHWICPILSLIPYGTGIMGLFLPITTYLVDCYPMYATSAIAASTELRSLVGAFLPLAGPPMYETLGLGWGNSLLGFLCALMIPLPILFYKFGKKLREMEKLKL
ncbi:major facilitator superfamily transporter [Diaporthe helianthi]|uniref:Major facilitator superfamily transporter n=1 Tax=Diaporthe helianthi TaxID=158607 RepID=A0A2P5HZI7_DIAHE|nr:major facilitator superfamily transporter [Diaporthe helianthi]